MRTNAFMDYLKDFHKQLGGLGLLDGKPHILVLGDGLASRVVVTSDAIRLAVDLNIVLFQLPPPHFAHHPALGRRKFQARGDESAVKLPPQERRDTAAEKRRARGNRRALRLEIELFTGAEQNKASFAAAELWPVNKDRAISRLWGTAKRKTRPTDRPPLEDVSIVASIQELEESLGGAAVKDLEVNGHLVVGVKASAVMVGGLLNR
ncbi:unnamed protein product [Ectocarpus sp. CCAP 1310/34]|nr:unnamed protein product [Ectocarpus sp. CCAP 1310/34]